MKRVFLDANVLFSASHAQSAFSELVRLICVRAHPVTSDFALEEARRNIGIKRPHWKPEFRAVIEPIEVVTSVSFPIDVELNIKDVPILCAAIKNRCDFLVTGDKRDFGHLYGKEVQGVMVLSPVSMAKALQSL